MSSHPNTMLFCILTPDDLARKTYRSILSSEGIDEDDSGVKIAGRTFSIQVMEEDYDDGYQIAAQEGQIVLHTYLTFDYGDRVEWDELVMIKDALQAWAESASAQHKCSYAISIGANYW